MTDAVRTPDFDVLLEVSASLGADPYHVQGPGGNTSIKTASGTMLVKASGFELADALREDIFAEVEPARIVAALQAGAADPLAGIVPLRGRKPSIETAMHAAMPHRVVVHTHSVPAVAVSCRADALVVLRTRLTGLPWAFVPYARPGTPLARAIVRSYRESPDASVLILGNHGVVVGHETPQGAHALLLEVVDRLDVEEPVKFDGHALAPDLETLGQLATRHGLELAAATDVHALALRPDLAAIAARGTLYPDHLIFLGPAAGVLADREATGGRVAPQLWLVPGSGVLMERGLPRAAHAMARCLADVVLRLGDAPAVSYLTPDDEAALLGMEEEVYRQELARQMR